MEDHISLPQNREKVSVKNVPTAATFVSVKKEENIPMNVFESSEDILQEKISSTLSLVLNKTNLAAVDKPQVSVPSNEKDISESCNKEYQKPNKAGLSYSEQRIREELNVMMSDTLKREEDPCCVNEDEMEKIDAAKYNANVEAIYIKEECEFVEDNKNEQESVENFHSECKDIDLDDTELRNSVKQHNIEFPVVNCNVALSSLFEDDAISTSSSNKGKTSTKDDGRIKRSQDRKKIFSQLNKLSVHVQKIDKRLNDYNCEQCGKKFSTTINLERHVNVVHKGEKIHECKECSRRFSQLGNLNGHIKTVHMGIKKYQCQKCQKYFTKLRSLNIHIRTIHEGIKSYECEICRKLFSQLTHLKMHINTVHCRIKKYECYICKKAFTESGNLSKHIRTIHEGISYKCKDCNRSFTQFAGFNKHISSVHSVNENYK